MNKKQLISSEGVRAAAKRGDQVIYLQDKSTIVTSEAASTAKALGITLELKKPPSEPPPDLKDSEQGETAIRRVLAAHTGGEIREDLLAEVMRRVALERASQASVQGTVQTQGSDPVRKLASIQLDGTAKAGALVSTFDLAILGANVGQPSAVGFMTWNQSIVNFKRPHDEVMVVLEGNLSFRMANDSVLAEIGDVILIPKNSQVEIGTKTSVRLFYASYNG
jgi:ethanolamine utilization protein EutQ (cupin superfamily)